MLQFVDKNGEPIESHFTESEFGAWFEHMDSGFLNTLNLFRHRLGYGVSISYAEGALGRYGGNSYSRHNIERWLSLCVADIMPEIHEPDRWIRIAKEVGFTGIGYYPDWHPRAGLHVDTRYGVHPDSTKVATWGRIGYRYVSLNKALNKGRRLL